MFFHEHQLWRTLRSNKTACDWQVSGEAVREVEGDRMRERTNARGGRVRYRMRESCPAYILLSLFFHLNCFIFANCDSASDSSSSSRAYVSM